MKIQFKYFNFILALSLLPGCINKDIVIHGRSKSIKNAVIEISGHGRSWDSNIIDGRFKIPARIERADFYKMKIRFGGNKTVEHSIYLDEGDYTIALDSVNIQSYPSIQTGVQFQNELSKFYTSSGPDSTRLKNFIIQHPESLVSGYLLNQVNRGRIRENPGYYNALHHVLHSKVKSTSYAREAKNAIDGFSRVLPGAEMPDINGITPSGGTFDRNLLKGKLTLVAFWASWNTPSIKDIPHLKYLFDKHHSKDFEILGIAIDKNEERWKKAIKANELNWLHVADFKGAYSKNFDNFYTNKLPCYIIIGPDLKIVDLEVPLESIEIYINDFLEQHSSE